MTIEDIVSLKKKLANKSRLMAKHTGSLFITDKVIKPPPVQLIRGENRPHYRRSIIIEK